MFRRCQMHTNVVSVLLLIASVFTLVGCEPSVPDQQSESHSTGEDVTMDMPMDMPLIIGTYTGSVKDTEVDASQGLYILNFDSNSGEAGQPELAAPIENPSFAAIDHDKQRVYVASETEAGQVAAFQWSADSAELKPINIVSSEGAYPCYLALSPDKTRLAVANYGSGNIAVYEIDPVSGAIGDTPQTRQHSGHGPNPQRQEAPHAHWVQWSPDGQFIYVVDLGIDQIVGYAVDPESGMLGEGFTAMKTSAGSGPRHMVFHPHKNLVYIFSELNNSVVMANRETDGTLTARQSLSSLPEGYSGSSYGAHIAISPDGKNLYASNRGHDSIVVFDIAEDGRLEPTQWVSTEGDWPRFFVLLPKQETLLVANERSHNIVVFHVGADGHLSPVGQSVQVAQPVYIGHL